MYVLYNTVARSLFIHTTSVMIRAWWQFTSTVLPYS